jgi:hypothetical protein
VRQFPAQETGRRVKALEYLFSAGLLTDSTDINLGVPQVSGNINAGDTDQAAQAGIIDMFTQQVTDLILNLMV